LTFTLSEDGLICQEKAKIIATITSDQWWNYRISELREKYNKLPTVDVSHYQPKEWTLSNFLPYRDERNNTPLKPYSLSYASYQVYIKEE